MLISIIIDEQELAKMILARLREETNLPLEIKDIQIQVKSKQNYKAEWEGASFRACISRDTACPRL